MILSLVDELEYNTNTRSKKYIDKIKRMFYNRFCKGIKQNT